MGARGHGVETERPDAAARAQMWRTAVPDITDDELAVLDPLLGAPHALRRLVAAHRAGVQQGADGAAKRIAELERWVTDRDERVATLEDQVGELEHEVGRT